MNKSEKTALTFHKSSQQNIASQGTFQGETGTLSELNEIFKILGLPFLFLNNKA